MEVLRYVTESGRDLIREWLDELRDARAAARVTLRIDRWRSETSATVNLCEREYESCGLGYRAYYAMVGRTCVLLLCAGDKRK
jgi:putative addiction module killer protein